MFQTWLHSTPTEDGFSSVKISKNDSFDIKYNQADNPSEIWQNTTKISHKTYFMRTGYRPGSVILFDFPWLHPVKKKIINWKRCLETQRLHNNTTKPTLPLKIDFNHSDSLITHLAWLNRCRANTIGESENISGGVWLEWDWTWDTGKHFVNGPLMFVKIT